MSLQILKIVLYNHKGKIRELNFNLKGLTILTGASKTGKSAIIDIVDYCTGSTECNVADGAIRNAVAWYAIIFQLNDAQIFIARKNPHKGDKTSSDIYLDRGHNIVIPDLSDIYKNTTVHAVESFLGASIGISENEHRPQMPTRDSLEANFRHALLFCIQDQNDIDSKMRLFHRQEIGFIAQAIKDTLPYFLGAIDEDRLLKQALLDQARKKYRQLERQVREAEQDNNNNYQQAKSLYYEARSLGLIDPKKSISTYEILLSIFKDIAKPDKIRNELMIIDDSNILENLRTKRQSMRSDLEQVNTEIRSLNSYVFEAKGYEGEGREQVARLSALGLVKNPEAINMNCPLCLHELKESVPTVIQINRSLTDLTEQLEEVTAENPRLQMRLALLQQKKTQIEGSLKENQQLINARITESEILRSQQDMFVLQARTIGKIQQYLQFTDKVEDNSTLKQEIESIKIRIAALEAELDVDSVKEKLQTFSNIIGSYITTYSHALDLEHKGSHLRLDIRNLTIVADTIDGPVPLYRMGSGENWVGYHILAHLGLHKWFRQKRRPVPGFVIFDQPSQAHYPPEKDIDGSLSVLKDEDQAAVYKLFKLIADVAKELYPEMQFIVLDHADLDDDWFQQAINERWRKGKKLIPASWL